MRKLGMLLGIVLGGVVGVLYAPFKGKELRKKMQKEQATKGGIGLGALWEGIKKLGGEIAESARETAKEYELDEAIKKGKETIKEMAEEGYAAAEKKIKKAGEKAEEKVKKEAKKAEKKVQSKVKKAKSTAKKAAKKAVKKAKSVVTKRKIK